MRSQLRIISLVASAMLAAASVAQTPASAPAGSTGLCRDGTYWTGATKKGACRGHKGVQDWYGSATSGSATSSGAAPASGAAAPAPAAAPAAPAPAAASTAPAATPPAAPKAAPAATKTAPAATTAPAPGGGAGQVWVNTSSKVYHCPSDRWYGKTKSGAYMSEADAIAQGNRADHGKACSK